MQIAWPKEHVRKRGFHTCSARLQAGIRVIQKCPPEGGRYKHAVQDQPNMRRPLRIAVFRLVFVGGSVKDSPG